MRRSRVTSGPKVSRAWGRTDTEFIRGIGVPESGVGWFIHEADEELLGPEEPTAARSLVWKFMILGNVKLKK